MLLISSLSLGAPSVLSAPDIFHNENSKSVEEQVNEYFADIPVMIEIARCESTFRQVGSDGNILRGKVNRSDVGVMQINKYYHADQAEALGLDLHTLGGNMVYARDLFEREGTAPWRSSMKCWGAENHVARK